jgi:hypothetical protein
LLCDYKGTNIKEETSLANYDAGVPNLFKSQPLLLHRIRKTIPNSIVITSPPLPLVRRILNAIRLCIISTSENPIPTILIQNIRIKKLALPRVSMSQVIRAHLGTRRSTHGRIIRLRLRKGLSADVRAVRGWSVDGRVVESCRAAETGHAGRRGEVVGVGASDYDIEGGTPLAAVGGLRECKGRAKEGAFDVRLGAWIGTIDIIRVL